MDQTSNTSNVATLASCFFISKKEEELVKHSTEEGSTLTQCSDRQGLYRSWKTCKVWNLSISFSKPGQAWNLIVGP